MSKEFTGSWVIVIILILICWPAALIYFFMKALLQNSTRHFANAKQLNSE